MRKRNGSISSCSIHISPKQGVSDELGIAIPSILRSFLEVMIKPFILDDGQFRPVVVVAIRPLALPWFLSAIGADLPSNPPWFQPRPGKVYTVHDQIEENYGSSKNHLTMDWRAKEFMEFMKTGREQLFTNDTNQRKIPAGPSGKGGETCQSSRYPSKRQGKRQGKRNSFHIPTAGGLGKKLVPTRSPNHPKLEHLSTETHGDLGIHHFKNQKLNTSINWYVLKLSKSGTISWLIIIPLLCLLFFYIQ